MEKAVRGLESSCGAAEGAPPGGMSGGNGPGKFVDGKTWSENRNVVEDAMMNCLSVPFAPGTPVCLAIVRSPGVGTHDGNNLHKRRVSLAIVEDESNVHMSEAGHDLHDQSRGSRCNDQGTLTAG